MARLTDRLQGHHDVMAHLIDAYSQDRLASTLLFSGTSGIGKKLAAFALAQVLTCEKFNREDAKGCGVCGSCLRVENQQSESVLLIQPDGAAIKIEQARDVLQFISLQKLGRSRVIIIDQAHLMNPQAANALLKSLEEPPSGTFFILITPVATAVLPTIRSRSQLVRFRPLSETEIKSVLGELLGSDIDDWVIESAQGSVERANRLLESREDYVELETAAKQFLSSAATSFPSEPVSKLRELMKEKHAQAFVSGLFQSVLRDALRLQAGLTTLNSERWQEEAKIAADMNPDALSDLIDFSLVLEHDMARNIDRGLLLENFAIEWRTALGQ